MNKLIYIFTLILFSFGMGACSDSFLERAPEGSYTDATFYSSPEALKAATAPLYNRAWFSYHERAVLAVGSLRANDAYNPYLWPEFTLFTETSLTQGVSTSWRSFYSVVTLANETLEAIRAKATNVSEQEKKQAMAEARLMRGIAYFYMVRLWGSVILFENNTDIIKNPLLPRHREEDIFKFIINDLTYAAENLPDSWDKGRATSWGAKGMLAKAYLARSGWKKGGTRDEADLAKAREIAGDVCMNSGISLYPNYEDLFKYKHNNNPESLIAMQWIPLGAWFVCNTLLADLAFSSKVTGGVNVWGGPQASPEILELYEPADSLRRNATYFTRGTYYPYIDIANGGYTYTEDRAYVKKGVVGGPNDDNDGKVESMKSPLNTYILRLADVYLTFAEASLGNSASLNGGDGLEYFNRVRDRAKVGRKTSITFDDIIKERRIEFSMEYCNWYDMVAWYCYQPDKMLQYFLDQHHGRIATIVAKDADGKIVFLPNGDNVIYEDPKNPVIINHNNIFLPYPENDLIQNPRLKEDPQPYKFNE